MRTARVTADAASAKGSSVDFFVNTGNAKDAPIACLGDNNGFPEVQSLYARQRSGVQGKDGVHVTIRFTGDATSGKGIAVNISQPTMTGDLTVIPLV